MLAAAAGDLDAIQGLLAAGADPRAVGEDAAGSPATALGEAIRCGRLEAVKLLAPQSDLDRPSEDGWTPLALAARKGRPEALLVLLAAGADPQARSFQGWTPLMTAISGAGNAWEDPELREFPAVRCLDLLLETGEFDRGFWESHTLLEDMDAVTPKLAGRAREILALRERAAIEGAAPEPEPSSPAGRARKVRV